MLMFTESTWILPAVIGSDVLCRENATLPPPSGPRSSTYRSLEPAWPREPRALFLLRFSSLCVTPPRPRCTSALELITTSRPVLAARCLVTVPLA